MDANLSNEFHQKYLNTYARVLLPKETEYRVAYISSCATNPDNTYNRFPVHLKFLVNASLSNVGIYSYDTLDFDFKFPALGYRFVRGYGTVFASRKVERQYKKGLCSATITFEYCHMELLSSISKQLHPYALCLPYAEADGVRELNVIEELYTPTFLGFKECLSRLHADKLGKKNHTFMMPVSPTWAISFSPNKNYDFLLFWENLPVGFIKNNYNSQYFDVTIAELYKQEWIDFYNRTGLQHGTTKIL